MKYFEPEKLLEKINDCNQKLIKLSDSKEKDCERLEDLLKYQELLIHVFNSKIKRNFNR